MKADEPGLLMSIDLNRSLTWRARAGSSSGLVVGEGRRVSRSKGPYEYRGTTISLAARVLCGPLALDLRLLIHQVWPVAYNSMYLKRHDVFGWTGRSVFMN